MAIRCKHELLKGTCSICNEAVVEKDRAELNAAFKEAEMESNNDQKEVVEKRVCPEPDCKLGNEEQPALRFKVHSSSGFPMGACSGCRGEGQNATEAEALS